jgi:hypothetical protein
MDIGCKALFYWSTEMMEAYMLDIVLLVYRNGNPTISVEINGFFPALFSRWPTW